jgi:hypothetical protein
VLGLRGFDEEGELEWGYCRLFGGDIDLCENVVIVVGHS